MIALKKEYEDFFKKSPNPVPMKALDFFNEEIKDVILYIKNADTLTWDKYENLLEKYKSNYEIKVALLRSDNTPTAIRDLILDNELKETTPNKFVLFECLKNYIPSISKIDSVIFHIGDDIIEKELKDAFKEGRKPVFHKDIIADFQNNFAERFNGYQFCHGVVSGNVFSRLIFDTKTNEEILTAICNNPNMKATHRDKVFDMGCNFYNITNYTPHMVEEIYKSCADTIFDIEIIDDELKENATNAINKIVELIKDEKLNDNLLFDLVCRIKSCDIPSNFPYAKTVMSGIAKHCKVPEVLGEIESMAVETMFNPHTPKHLLERKANIITEGLLNRKMDDETIKNQLKSYAPKIDLGINNLQRIIRNIKPKIHQVLAELTEIPLTILEEIQKENIDERYRLLCNINIGLKKAGIDLENRKYIMKFLSSDKILNDFNISSDLDIGNPITTEIYNTLHTLLKNEIKKLETPSVIKEFQNKKEDLEAGYQFRDLSVDFNSFYVFVKNLDSFAKCGTANIVLKPDLTNKEMENFLKSINHPDTLLTPRDEIFYAIDVMEDKVLFYESIDNYIDMVNQIDNRSKELEEKNKEFEYEK